MPRLILQFENSTLKEYAVGLNLTIGRLPDNTVIIDNPAVSGHHACVFRDGDHFVVEDLHSTNGTFVNEKRVTRYRLQDGDAVLVGKHSLVFDHMAGGQAAQDAECTLANLDDTVYLDTQKHRELLAKMTSVRWTQLKNAAAAQTAMKLTATPWGGAKVGVLRVVAGRADQSEFSLEAHTSLIGKSDGALVHLQGWFKPKVAVVITRSADGYVVTRLHGKTRINNQPLSGRQNLKDGDMLSVSGLMLEFSLKTLVQESRKAAQTVASAERRVVGSRS